MHAHYLGYYIVALESGSRLYSKKDVRETFLSIISYTDTAY